MLNQNQSVAKHNCHRHTLIQTRFTRITNYTFKIITIFKIVVYNIHYSFVEPMHLLQFQCATNNIYPIPIIWRLITQLELSIKFSQLDGEITLHIQCSLIFRALKYYFTVQVEEKNKLIILFKTYVISSQNATTNSEVSITAFITNERTNHHL